MDWSLVVLCWECWESFLVMTRPVTSGTLKRWLFLLAETNFNSAMLSRVRAWTVGVVVAEKTRRTEIKRG